MVACIFSFVFIDSQLPTPPCEGSTKDSQRKKLLDKLKINAIRVREVYVCLLGHTSGKRTIQRWHWFDVLLRNEYMYCLLKHISKHIYFSGDIRYSSFLALINRLQDNMVFINYFALTIEKHNYMQLNIKYRMRCYMSYAIYVDLIILSFTVIMFVYSIS